MTQSLVNFFRMTICSVAAIALAACARFGGPQDWVSDGDGDTNNVAGQLPDAPSFRGLQAAEDARLANLERQIVDLNSEIGDLRAALEIMGPFDDVAAPAGDLADPRPMADLSAASASIDLSEIYAPAPKLAGGVSLFHAVELGAYPTVSAAEADWARLASEIDLSGLSPKFSDETPGVRLSAGPVMSAVDADSLCAELVALAGACTPADQWGAVH